MLLLGLHPSVRESRKSMAKELVCLQEKLDLLGSQASEGQGVEKVETRQPKDVHGLSSEENVEASTEIEEHMDEKQADSDSLLAGQIKLRNISLPSNEDLNSREAAGKEKIEEPSLVHIDGQSAPANCNLENEQTLASTKQPKEVQEVQSEENAGTIPKFEEHKELKAAESQDSDSIVESQIESSAAVQSNIELTDGREPVSDGAASEDGCLLTESSDGHEDQPESPMQATEVTLQTYKNMEVPDLTVTEVPEFNGHMQDSSGASTGLQEEEEKEALLLAVPAMNNASTEVTKDMVVPDLAVILPELDKEVSEHKQNSSGASTVLQEEQEKEELELAVPVMNNASTEVYKDMEMPDSSVIELPELDQKISKHKQDLSRASTDLQEEKEKEEQELAAPVMNNASTAEASEEITGFATVERQIQDATCSSQGLKMVGESLNKCLEEQVETAKGDGDGFGDLGDGVVTISLSDADNEAAYTADTKLQDELLDSVMLACPTPAHSDYCTSEDYKRTMVEISNCDGTDGHFEVSDAQAEAEDKAEENAPIGSKDKEEQISSKDKEEQNDDAFNEWNTTEAPNAVSMEKDVLHISPGVSSTSESSMVSNEIAFPRSEGSSADVQGELLESPQEAIAVHSIALNSEEKKLLEENEKLREMLERLLEAGKQQLQVISDLNGRVEHLERKLSQKGKARAKRYRLPKSPARKTVSPAA